MDRELLGKVAIVTGAGRLRGIGRATAVSLARLGAKIVVTGTGRDPNTFPEDEKEIGWKDVESTADQIRDEGSEALTMTTNISRETEVNELFERTLETFGRVDILVNNAAVLRMASVKDMTDSLWREVISTNLDSVFFMCRAFIPLMGAGGSIVNISSAAAHRGAIDHSAYAATKAAVLAFSRSLARELAPDIRCNAISPGMIDTEMLDELPTETVELLKAESPLNRLGKPSEIAGAVGFLCSETSSFVTAETLHVNGACYIAS